MTAMFDDKAFGVHMGKVFAYCSIFNGAILGPLYGVMCDKIGFKWSLSLQP